MIADFNPRPPRGGRQGFLSSSQSYRDDFNPRPPRGGRPHERSLQMATKTQFQSTPSARRATSICARPGLCSAYFNPRPPRGGRRLFKTGERLLHKISIHALREEGDDRLRDDAVVAVRFQSTPSARRATLVASGVNFAMMYFNPRPPRGGRLDRAGGAAGHHEISIHALREEGDSKSGEKIHHVCSIIHTCAQFEKELYEGSGEMQNKSC